MAILIMKKRKQGTPRVEAGRFPTVRGNLHDRRTRSHAPVTRSPAPTDTQAQLNLLEARDSSSSRSLLFSASAAALLYLGLRRATKPLVLPPAAQK